MPMPEENCFCLECGREIKYGRNDKKFCSGDCKNLYHNRNRRAREVVLSRMQNILKNNYSILARILMSGCSAVMIEDVEPMGFDIMYYTEHRKVGRRKEYACFDILYYMSERKLFNIHRIDADKNVIGYICRKSRKP